MDSGISILSINCQGLNNAQKRRDVFHYLRSKKHSIYFLQDTHFEKKMEAHVLAEWGYTGFFSSYRSNARGVAIMFNNNFEFKVKKIDSDCSGNYIILLIETQKQSFLLVNIYGPNKDEPEFFDKLKEKISENDVDHVILAGDFNLVLNPAIDYENYKHINNIKSKEVVEKMIDNLDLNDIWRDLNPESPRYTWRRNNPRQQARLDFFLISDSVISLVDEADIQFGYRTDHSPVLLKLKFQENIRRNTFWKFNSSLLRDKSFVDEINNEINNVKEEYIISPKETPDEKLIFSIPDELFLDFLLMKIRSKTISYAVNKNKKSREEEKQLEQTISFLDKMEQKDIQEIRDLEIKREQLKDIREKRMRGVLLRSRARWIAEGEKISNYFCNLEKRHYVSKHMARIIDKGGNTLNKQEDILCEVQQFYKSLYANIDVENCEINNLVNNIPCLSDIDASELEGNITLDEATSALRNMKNNKSPGTDGFTVEFFKFFWKKIGIFVVRALNASFKKGEMSSVQKEGMITCIPKGDKPREYVQNWRPISLLNVVYKIGSTCIANRLKTVLPTLINEDQTGFIRNRYIGDNIRLIFDTIAYLDHNNLPGLLLNIDFEKAFDSVNWNFMFKVLKSFGFKEDICRWVFIFYKNIKSCVIVNGQVSHWFEVKRGCRQGDPISPYLFILCVEVLAIMIRENPDIKGITINNVENKLTQYADDTEFLLDGEKKSFETCIDVIFRFGRVSGLHINSSKTSATWLGSKRNCNTRFMPHLDMDWNPAKFKILGIWFSNDLKECVNVNYADKLAEIRYLFKIWVKRQLTPLGRVAVLKSMILSKLTHLWLLLPNPPDIFFQTCQQMCYRFIWNNKPDKISRKNVHKSIQKGGIGFPDIKIFVLSLKLSWIRRAKKSTHKWKDIFLNNFPDWPFIEQHGPEYVSKFTKYNTFWADVFDSYKHYFYKCEPKNSAELLAEPLCYNKRILVGKTWITSKLLIRKNIVCLSKFFDDNGQSLSHTCFKEKFDLNIDFLTFAGYISAIREFINKYDIVVNDNKCINLSLCFTSILACLKGSRMYYDKFIENNVKMKCCTKWDSKLMINNNWRSIFALTHKINDVKLKWFQLKILHRCLGTNIILKEIGVSENDKCSFCKTHKDSIDHVFWKCTKVNIFWKSLVDLLRNRCVHAENLRLTEQVVLLGYDETIVTDTVLDFIILFAKYYLYMCKLDGNLPQLTIFINKLKTRFKIEEHNASLNFQYINFCTNWLPYKNIITN